MKRFCRPTALIALSLAAIVASSCTSDEQVRPAPDRGGAGSARALGIFSTEYPEDTREQAMQVLAQDAYHRENRFLDAAQHGYLFASTRVPQAEIESGQWSHEDLFQIGAQLFHVTFTPELGFGGADLPPIARFHRGRRGGPDAYSCASCHWRGGPAGAGDAADNAYFDGDGDTQASALARNPIALPGAGLVEIVAREMSAELMAKKSVLVLRAAKAGSVLREELFAKGISFGFLSARPDGSLDTSELAGVDPDLVIKPFGWKGSFATLRDIIEDALLVHHGMESDYLVAHGDQERLGPFGGEDPDGDGFVHEIEEGQVSALTIFSAMQEVPQEIMPTDPDVLSVWPKGRKLFDEIGCGSCHVPSLPIADPVFILPSRTGGAELKLDLAKEGATPRLEGKEIKLFSDLKRHDMGPDLADARADRGIAGNMFLTRPLWGIARSRPYMHDARAQSLETAILLHGGEAQTSRDAYAALDESGRAPIRVFLTSLSRARRIVTP